MRPLPSLLTLAFASAAGAQSWEFTFSHETLSPENPSTTVMLWASFAPSDWAFAGADLDLHASEPGWEPGSPERRLVQPGQVPGEVTPDRRSITGIGVGQIYGTGFHPDPDNPIEVWRATFAITDFTPRRITLSTDTEQFFVYPQDLGFGSPTEPRTPIDVEIPIQVIPAPAPLGLLGLAALAATRRRRPH
jgi:hypothetical protein